MPSCALANLRKMPGVIRYAYARAGGVFGILPCRVCICYAKCRFRTCGAVLLLNVANVVMLPIPMLPVINLSRRPHWELKIETGNTCILATFYNAPTLRVKGFLFSLQLPHQGLRHPIGHTMTPSFRRYAKSPSATRTIMNDGFFMRVTSIFSATAINDAAPFSINVSPPNFTSIRP